MRANPLDTRKWRESSSQAQQNRGFEQTSPREPEKQNKIFKLDESKQGESEMGKTYVGETPKKKIWRDKACSPAPPHPRLSLGESAHPVPEEAAQRLRGRPGPRGAPMRMWGPFRSPAGWDVGASTPGKQPSRDASALESPRAKHEAQMMTNTEKMPYIELTASKQPVHAGNWTPAQVKQPVVAPVDPEQLGAGCADQPPGLTGRRATNRQKPCLALTSPWE